MTCLLCHEIDLSQLTFVELMLLKPKQNVICQTCKGSFEALSRGWVAKHVASKFPKNNVKIVFIGVKKV